MSLIFTNLVGNNFKFICYEMLASQFIISRFMSPGDDSYLLMIATHIASKFVNVNIEQYSYTKRMLIYHFCCFIASPHFITSDYLSLQSTQNNLYSSIEICEQIASIYW